MKRSFFLLKLLAASVVCGWCSILPYADGFGGKQENTPPSMAGEFMANLLQSLQNGKDGKAGLKDMLEKFALNMGDLNENDIKPFANASEGIPDLSEFMKEAGGASGDTPDLSNFPNMQALAEKFLSESGEDGGLLRHFRELQSMNDGPLDLSKLASTFKGLSEALKKRGTDINALMEEVLQSPQAQLPPVAPPVGLKQLYRKGATQQTEDMHGTDLKRPQAVSFSVIKNAIGTFSEELPVPIEGARCHALVLSGAIARAPLQAGAILGLVEQYKARRRPLRWDVVAGVNRAAISAATSLGFSAGQNGELDWARFLWDHWHRVRLEWFLRCPKGIKDLMNLPKVLEWLLASQEAVSSGEDPLKLGLPHACDTAAAAETLANTLQQMPDPPAVAAEDMRVAVITAARLGGGKGVWEFIGGIGSGETCIAPVSPLPWPEAVTTCPRSEAEELFSLLKPQTELDQTLAALLASNATPGVTPLVKVWGPPGPHGPREGIPAPKGPRRMQGPYWEKPTAYADGRLVANISAGEAIRACQRKAMLRGETDRDLQRGKGIVLDIIGTVPLEQPDVEDQLVKIANVLKITKETSQQKTNTLSAKRLIEKIQKAYPLVRIRHVLFPEETFELMSDYGDYRGAKALLHHGRLMGWRATTLEDVE